MENSRSDDLSISVIVPVKNSTRTIRDLLDSLMEMDYDEDMLEIIVVDGHSKRRHEEDRRGVPGAPDRRGGLRRQRRQEHGDKVVEPGR